MMSDPHQDELDRIDMQALAQGDDQALNSIMTRHAEPLFHYLIRLLQSESDAEELAQETFCRVYRHRDRFRGNSKFSTWLYAIATNLARDQIRRKMRRPQLSLEQAVESSGAPLVESLAAAGATPSEELENQERSAAVRKAISELPDDLRIPLVLAEYEDCSQNEAAAIIGCSAKALEMRLYRARQLLRKRLAGWVSDRRIKKP